MNNARIGISGYGCYVPRYRIRTSEIARVWGRDGSEITESLGVSEKSVADRDEDTITMAVESGRNALMMAGIDPKLIGGLFIGSESHPYITKPSGTVVSEALNIGHDVMMADYTFACKAGTAAMQTCLSLVASGQIRYGLAIGSDTAQGRPGDALEFTAACGSAAFVLGSDPIAILEDTYSFTSDTSDFWRRDLRKYPGHGARFTGDPAYFRHVISAANGLMERLGSSPNDYDWVVLHMPNAKFPVKAAKMIGFDLEKLKPSLIVTDIGNTYSGSSLLGLCSTLSRVAKPGHKILMVSYGSGAGSDAFSFLVTDSIEERKNRVHSIDWFLQRKTYVDYANYARLRGKIAKNNM
jgi:hydroxymethylglutaryl-CoA synthase